MRLRLVLIALVLAAVAAAVAVGLTRSSGSPAGSPTSPGRSRTPPARSPASSSSAGPSAVVQAYWHDITSGHFRAAFRYFDRAEQKRTHGEQWFVNDKARDAPIRARLKLGTVAVNGSLATVPIVLLRTVGSLTGCHRWTGNYGLREFDSRWLIDTANIHKHSC